MFARFIFAAVTVSFIGLVPTRADDAPAEPTANSAPTLVWPDVRRETKPWTRWWWFGNIGDEKSLTSEMERYAAAGFGGLEITPIYGVRGYEERFVSFLSPRWMELLAHTLKEARRLDLGIDLATGTGWPFGGPWLADADAAQYLAHRTFQVGPGERLREPVVFNQTGIVRVAGPRHVTLDELKQPVSANDNLQELALDQVRFETALPLLSLMAFPSAVPPTADAGAISTPLSARDRNVKPVTANETPPSEQHSTMDGDSPLAGSDGLNPRALTAAPLDLTARVRADGTLDWTAPDDSGSWTLYALFQGQHGKMVERAAPGGEGYALDHLSSSALENYLARFDAAFREAHWSTASGLGAPSVGRTVPGEPLPDVPAGFPVVRSETSPPGRRAPPLTEFRIRDTHSGVRAFFNDSYEVDDAMGEANWTPRFLEEFEARRGYDLRTRLPELFAAGESDPGARVRSDFRETISDLLLDAFTRPWRAWANQRGALIRNQAHNAPANILDLYAASDIPEQEGNGFLAIKLASSAAHVTGKPLASAETATWLNEHFLTTLAELKANADEFLLAGINHLCYHGTPFSPPEDPWPGFQFYASVEISPANPLWTNLPALNAYVTRAQSFLQPEPDSSSDRINPAAAPDGPDEDVLLYYNIHDRWGAAGGEGLPHFGHGGRDPVGVSAGALAAELHAAEIGFDYISDRLLLAVSATAAGDSPERDTTPAPHQTSQAQLPAPSVGQEDRKSQTPNETARQSESWGRDALVASFKNATRASRLHEISAQDRPPVAPETQTRKVATNAATLQAAGARYRAIVIPATTFMPEATLAHLVKLATDGATILVHQHLPRSAPGLSGALEPAGFNRLLEQIRTRPSAPGGHERERVDADRPINAGDHAQDGAVAADVGRGRIVIAADLPTLLSHVPGLPRENLRMHGLEFVRRKVRNGTAYFVVNRSEKPVDRWIRFATPAAAAEIFDPMTGAAGVAAWRPSSEGNQSEVFLQLAPGASAIVRLHDASADGPAWSYWRIEDNARELAGEWSVRFIDGGPALPSPARVEKLSSWTDFAGEAGRAFAGTALYTLTFTRPDLSGAAWELDLGAVFDSARVVLNGRELATLIQPPWRAVIPADALREHNTLEIFVTNLAANRLADLDRRGVPWKKFYNANMPARLRENTGPDRLFTAAHWLPRNSGLLGPVKLTPLQILDPSKL